MAQKPMFRRRKSHKGFWVFLILAGAGLPGAWALRYYYPDSRMTAELNSTADSVSGSMEGLMAGSAPADLADAGRPAGPDRSSSVPPRIKAAEARLPCGLDALNGRPVGSYGSAYPPLPSLEAIASARKAGRPARYWSGQCFSGISPHQDGGIGLQYLGNGYYIHRMGPGKVIGAYYNRFDTRRLYPGRAYTWLANGTAKIDTYGGKISVPVFSAVIPLSAEAASDHAARGEEKAIPSSSSVEKIDNSENAPPVRSPEALSTPKSRGETGPLPAVPGASASAPRAPRRQPSEADRLNAGQISGGGLF